MVSQLAFLVDLMIFVGIAGGLFLEIHVLLLRTRVKKLEDKMQALIPQKEEAKGSDRPK
jgi:hypothetical protein